MSTQVGWTSEMWLNSAFCLAPLLIQQAAAFRVCPFTWPQCHELCRKCYTSVPSLPTGTTGRYCLEEVALNSEGELLCMWECRAFWGNNTGPLSSSLRLNFMSFKWDLRIAMIFECFPHNGGKGPIPSGDWHKKYPIPHTLRKPNLNCWVSYSIVRLSCGGEHGACPQIHSALFETTFMQPLQKHLPVVQAHSH